MSNEPEYRDVNPETENLPGKGRSAIITIFGGVVLFLLTVVVRLVSLPVRLAIGFFILVVGIQMLLRRKKYNFKMALVVTIAGTLLLLANPTVGKIAAAVAGTLLTIGSLGLIVLGLARAIKLSWDLGKRS